MIQRETRWETPPLPMFKLAISKTQDEQHLATRLEDRGFRLRHLRLSSARVLHFHALLFIVRRLYMRMFICACAYVPLKNTTQRD